MTRQISNEGMDGLLGEPEPIMARQSDECASDEPVSDAQRTALEYYATQNGYEDVTPEHNLEWWSKRFLKWGVPPLGVGALLTALIIRNAQSSNGAEQSAATGAPFDTVQSSASRTAASSEHTVPAHHVSSASASHKPKVVQVLPGSTKGSVSVTNVQPSKPAAPGLAPSCVEPLASSNRAHKLACQALRDGTFAFVDFTGSGTNVNAIAQQTVAGLAHASGGYLAPKTAVLPASSAAAARLRSQEQTDDQGNVCLKPAGSRNLASDRVYAPLAGIAVATMPELKRYQAVFAVGLESCPDGDQAETAGQANPLTNHGDIYTQLANSDGGTPQVLSDTEMEGTAMHEAGHVYGLDHSGTVENCDAPSSDSYGGQPVAVESYLNTTCQYNEYGEDGNMMSSEGGGPGAPAETLLSDVQRDFLQQSSVTSVHPHGITIVGQSVVIGTQAANSYASLPLPAESVNNQDLTDFDQLDFVAGSDGRGQASIRLMANTPFTNPNKHKLNTAAMREVTLADIPFANGNTQLTFTVGSKTVTATVQPNSNMQLQLTGN